MFTKKTIIIMLIAIGAMIIFIAGLLLWQNYSGFNLLFKKQGESAKTGETAAGIEAGKEKTKDLIAEVKDLAAGNDKDKIAQIITVKRDNGDGLAKEEQAVVAAPNSNPISVETGEVLTRDGTANAKEGGRGGDSGDVLQSGSIDPSKLPAGAVKISISPSAITPSEFSVNPGQAVLLAVTAERSIEIFKFSDASLSAVTAGLKPGETAVLTFNAPLKTGEYAFYSDFLNHRSMGAAGKMIVK
jgi:plastocyanin